jgi:hypothetical protein
MDNELLDQYENLRTLVESLNRDIIKHSQGNKSAGLRVRKGLRETKKLASDLVRASLEVAK